MIDTSTVRQTLLPAASAVGTGGGTGSTLRIKRGLCSLAEGFPQGLAHHAPLLCHDCHPTPLGGGAPAASG